MVRLERDLILLTSWSMKSLISPILRTWPEPRAPMISMLVQARFTSVALAVVG